MDKVEFISKLADALQLNADELSDDFSLNEENWDSFAQLGAISIIDEMFGITVPANDLKDCHTIDELLKLVERNLTMA